MYILSIYQKVSSCLRPKLRPLILVSLTVVLTSPPDKHPFSFLSSFFIPLHHQDPPSPKVYIVSTLIFYIHSVFATVIFFLSSPFYPYCHIPLTSSSLHNLLLSLLILPMQVYPRLLHIQRMPSPSANQSFLLF